MVDKLAVVVLLGTTFIDELIESIHPVESKIVPHHSLLVLVLMAHEAKSEAENIASDMHKFMDQDPELLITPISVGTKYITAVLKGVLKVMREAPDLVSTQVMDLVEVFPHKIVTRNHALIKAKESLMSTRTALVTSESPASACLMYTFQNIRRLVKFQMRQSK